MNSKFKKILIILCLWAILALPTLALAASDIETMLNEAAGEQGAGFDTSKPADIGLAIVAGWITSIFLSLLGIVFIAYLIYGGYLWLTAAGNEERLTKAKSIIRNGIIGLIVVLSAAAIYLFIRNALIGPLDTTAGPGAVGF